MATDLAANGGFSSISPININPDQKEATPDGAPNPATTPKYVSAEALLAAFRVPDTFAQVEEIAGTDEIEVGNPPSKAFVMAKPGVSMRIAFVKMTEGRGEKIYFIHPNVLPMLKDDAKLADVYQGLTHGGATFLWVSRVGGDSWATSMATIVSLAQGAWVRVVSEQSNDRRSGGRYVHKFAKGDLGDPAWPTESFAELFARGAADRTISTPDHPVIKALTGNLPRIRTGG